MKLFDLEAAKRGEPIQTRDGRPVKFIAHVPDAYEESRLIVQVGRDVRFYFDNGKLTNYGCGETHDLFMAPRKRTVWVNLHPYAGKSSYGYPATVYATKEMADAVSDQDRQGNRAWPLEIEE